MKHLCTIFLILCFSCSFSCYAQEKNLLHKTYAQRLLPLSGLYNYIFETRDPVKIFPKIDSIKRLAIDNKDDDLLMEAKLLRANYFFVSNQPPKTVLAVIDSLKEEGVKMKKIWVQALAENTAALYNFDFLHQYEAGFERHQRVFHLIKEVSPVEFPYKQDCLNQIASEYFMFHDFREAIFFSQEALKAEPEIALHAFPMRLSILTTLGLCYQQLNNLDSSNYYFAESHKLATKYNSTVWKGISDGNLGYNYFLQKKYAQAIPLLQNDIAVAKDAKDWGLAAGSLMVLADISLRHNAIQEADQLLATARDYVYRSDQYSRLEKLYPLLAKLYAAKGNPVLAATFIDSSLLAKDSLARKFNTLQVTRATQKVEMEQLKAEVLSINDQKKIKILERNILIAIVLLLMFTSLAVYRQLRRKYLLKQRQLIFAEQELSLATKQLDDFTKRISEKNSIIELLEHEKSEGSQNTIIQLQQSTILPDEDWEYFRQLFEKVHAGFLQRLKEKMPGLTPAETRFMALSKLDLSNKEMASMLGVGTDAIRQYRSRLRKKFHLGEDGNIEEMVGSI